MACYNLRPTAGGGGGALLGRCSYRAHLNSDGLIKSFTVAAVKSPCYTLCYAMQLAVKHKFTVVAWLLLQPQNVRHISNLHRFCRSFTNYLAARCKFNNGYDNYGSSPITRAAGEQECNFLFMFHNLFSKAADSGTQ